MAQIPNTYRKSVFSRKRTLANIDRRGLLQVNCGELVDLADITVQVVSRAIQLYTIINRIRWFMLKHKVGDSMSEEQDVLFSASHQRHWVVFVELCMQCQCFQKKFFGSFLPGFVCLTGHVEQEPIFYTFILVCKNIIIVMNLLTFFS